MEILDTPNPNAKKILIEHDLENSIYIDENTVTNISEISILLSISGIDNIFTGPGFVTISKTSELAWDNIIEDINSKLDNI
tara:strand:+ start:144 stop:386 length:243 start_codon:yes stop_codon:yes gene_type:complete